MNFGISTFGAGRAAFDTSKALRPDARAALFQDFRNPGRLNGIGK
jgi:hypothetical protein